MLLVVDGCSDLLDTAPVVRQIEDDRYAISLDAGVAVSGTSEEVYTYALSLAQAVARASGRPVPAVPPF